VIKEETEKILKYKYRNTEVQLMWNMTAKVKTVNNMCNWNHLRIIETIPKQHNRQEGNQETTKGGHVGH